MVIIKKIFICTVTCFELRDINLRVQNGWDIYRTVYQCSINYKIFLMIASSGRFDSMHAYIPLQFVGSIIL